MILKKLIACLVWFILGVHVALLFDAIHHSEPVNMWVVIGAPVICSALTVIQFNIKVK